MARWCFFAWTAPLTRAMGELLCVRGLTWSAGGGCRGRCRPVPLRGGGRARRCIPPGTARWRSGGPGGVSDRRRPWPPLLQAEHPLDLLLVAGREVRLPAQAPLALGGLVLQQVRTERLATAEPPRPGHLDALLGAAVRLHLGHRVYPLPSLDSAAGDGSPTVAAGAAADSAGASASSASGGTAAGTGSSTAGAGAAVPGAAAALTASACSTTARACSSAADTPLLELADRDDPAGLARFSGASTMTMLRPSSRGTDSDLPRPSIWSAIRSRIFFPSSGWKTSRPRNMIVILTLWPSSRNLATWRVLVSKSPGPILGRYFISLTPTFWVLRRDSLAFCASSNLNLPSSMMRQTGGLAPGATSTRSRSRSRAMASASGRSLMPSCSPSGSTRRTSRARMRSLMRGSVVVLVAIRLHSLFHGRGGPRPTVKERSQHRDGRRLSASGPMDPSHGCPAGAGHGGRVGDSHREAPLPRLSVALGYQS